MNFELDWLKRWSFYSPKRIAVKDGDSGESLSYQALYKKSLSLASRLKSKHNIQSQDRVILLAQNEIESLILFFALQRLGASLVPINFRLTPREISHIIEDSQPKLIVAQKAFLLNLSDINLPIEEMSHQEGLFSNLEEEPPFLPFEAKPESTALILYTSGTTGTPKGAILSHKMLFWNSINTSLRLNITQNDAAVIFLPLFHTGGWNVLTTPFLHRGAQVVLLKKFDASLVLKLTAEEKCTLLFGVPTTMSLMAHVPEFEQTDLSTLRYSIVGGEPMPLDLIHIWHKKGVPIRQGYGLTEFGPNVFSLNEEHTITKMGSIGYPNFYVNVKVLNQQGNVCKPNEVGELLLEGPMCMSGYWKNEKATQETIKEGWLHTGDLVKYDEDGFYYVVGRKKDMFISGGENVYPAEVEQVISLLPQVREVAVIGVPDDKWGEVGKAFLVCSSPLSEEDLINHCHKNLAKFKCPKHFEFMAELPKGDSGKILKRLLK